MRAHEVGGGGPGNWSEHYVPITNADAAITVAEGDPRCP